MSRSRNLRLAAREHLAEAAALHGEGARGAAVRSLREAGEAAVTELVERAGGPPDVRLLPPLAADALRADGLSPEPVRAVLHEVAFDCHEQSRGARTQLAGDAVAHAIEVVQALVDVAAGVRLVRRGRAEAADGEADPSPWGPHGREAAQVPGRPGPWIAAERHRRRGARVRSTLACVGIATVMAVAPLAAWIAGPARDPAAKLDVMARASGLVQAAQRSSAMRLPSVAERSPLHLP